MEPIEGAAESTVHTGNVWATSTVSARARIRALFADALQVPDADVDPAADFFIMGGHSVSAGQIVGTIRKETGVRVGLVAFFEDPTVEGLAEIVVAGARTGRSR